MLLLAVVSRDHVRGVLTCAILSLRAYAYEYSRLKMEVPGMLILSSSAGIKVDTYAGFTGIPAAFPLKGRWGGEEGPASIMVASQ